MIYTFAVCTMKTPDDGQRNCPKHVEFHFKNRFEKLVHLVGFVIRKECRRVRLVKQSFITKYIYAVPNILGGLLQRKLCEFEVQMCWLFSCKWYIKR